MNRPPPWSEATRHAVERLGDVGQTNADLGPWCTYRVGGPAAILVKVHHLDQLALVSEVVKETAIPVLVVGKGSNLLVADRGFDGIVLNLGDEFASIQIEDRSLNAGGAALLPVVARRSAKAGLTGFEWAVGVPGTVGGAVRMNAGGHGSDIAETFVEARLFDLANGTSDIRTRSELNFGYRTSAVVSTELVLDARFRLETGEQTESETTISEIVRWRRQHQPGGQNAGSVFANPEGDSAGRLIDSVGLKGLRHNTAVVSEKHANFIQCDAGGSADDVFALIRVIQDRVEHNTGVLLRPENRLIGFPEPSTLTQDLNVADVSDTCGPSETQVIPPKSV